MKFTPRARKAMLTLHLVTSLGWLGADLVLLTLGISGLTGAGAPEVVYPAMGLVGAFLFLPLTYVVWVVGVLNSLGTPWGLVTWWWVAIKLAIVTGMVFLVTFLLYPNLADARALGAALPDEQRVDLLAAPIVSSTLLIVTTVLSTYKPWGKLKRRRVPVPAVR